METPEQSKGSSNRRYTGAEKEQAVRLVRQLRKELGTDQGVVARVARQLGYGVESVRSWVKQADIDEGERPGTTRRGRRADQDPRAGEPRAQALQRDLAPGLGVFCPGGARPPVEVIVDFIDANRDELGVEPICRDLQVAPSTYYAAKSRPLSARAVRDAVLIPILVTLWKDNSQGLRGENSGAPPAVPATTSGVTRWPAHGQPGIEGLARDANGRHDQGRSRRGSPPRPRRARLQCRSSRTGYGCRT